MQTPQNIPLPIPASFELGYSSQLSQVLSVTPKMVQAPISGVPGYPYVAEGVYTLTFSVVNKMGVYPGYYTAAITFGTQELGEASGWGMQNPHQITIQFPSPSYIIIDKSLTETDQSGPVQSDQPLTIHFTGGGWPLVFSNVSLTFTPD